MFFTYHQNNSYGRFDYDYDKGISRNVIVEADTANVANARAEDIGLYFDGEGDCHCCGTRWSDAWGDTEGTPSPQCYGTPAANELAWYHDRDGMEWEGFIHFADGLKVGFANSDGTPGLEVIAPAATPIKKTRAKKAIETKKDAA